MRTTFADIPLARTSPFADIPLSPTSPFRRHPPFADMPGVLARGEDIAAHVAEHLGAVFAAEQTR